MYQITLKRSASGPPLPTDPVTPTTSPTTAPTTPALSVSSSVLQITDNYLAGFNVQTANNKVQDLASLISYTSGYRMEVRNKDNVVITEGNVGTGSKIHFYASGQTSPARTLTVIIYGDANGDGLVNSIDMNYVFEHRMGRLLIDEPYLSAMDTNRDGLINSIDMKMCIRDRDDDELPPPMTPAEFEAHLTAQRFPESYKPALRALYQKYPHWEFRAFFPRANGGGTVNWNTALAQQSRIGTSMVPIGSTNAFKSFDPKTYDFTRNSWYHLDRGWTGASPEAVAYYLDPRNFLDEQSIFMFESLAYDSEFHTLASVRQALSNTFMGNTTKYDGVDENGASVSLDHAEMFMRAAQYSGCLLYTSRCV